METITMNGPTDQAHHTHLTALFLCPSGKSMPVGCTSNAALPSARLGQSAKSDASTSSKVETNSYTSSLPLSTTRSSVPAESRFTKQKPEKSTDATLHCLAANRSLKTKKAVAEALRELGLPRRPAYINQVFSYREEHDIQRKTRSARRARARTGRDNPLRARSSISTTPVLLPRGTPQERLKALRSYKLKAVALKLMRNGATGGTSFCVTLCDDPAEVNYRVEMGCNWDTYGGSFKGWRANEDHHKVTIPTHWMTRVLRRGIANLSGLLTLDAVAVGSGSPDIELYRATWARQGRGYAVITERGFIALSGNYNFHAETAERALNGIRRKLASAG